MIRMVALHNADTSRLQDQIRIRFH